VEHAKDGQECVAMLENTDGNYYDLILMDVQMPRMNGYEATRAIRGLVDEKKARIPIVAMTANAFEEDRKEAFKAGMDGHLSKPIDIRELMRGMAKVFR
jgi:CheY-like chemotaxis protein